MKEPAKIQIGVDGFQRNRTEDQRLSKVIAATFKTDSGKATLSYLRSITIEAVHGGKVQTNELIHMEGQRYLVGLIERRINQASKTT